MREAPMISPWLIALSVVFSFKGLRSYKAKFEPAWEELGRISRA